MKRLLAALVVSSVAAAGPDIPDLAKRLGSQDPEVRQKAGEELRALADTDPQSLAPLLGDPDPEVSAAARETMERRGVFEDPAKTARCRELLKQLGATEAGAKGRGEAIRELLELGGPAVCVVQGELEATPACEQVREPVKVLAVGVTATLSLRAKNTGTTALWWCPSLNSLYTTTEPFGRRPSTGFGGGMRAGIRSSCGGREDKRTAEQKVIDALSALARVPAGESFTIASADVVPRRSCLLSAAVTRFSTTRDVPEGVFSGRSLRADYRDFDLHPRSTFAALKETSNYAFRARVFRDEDGKWSLELTALDDRPAPWAKGTSFDPFWWAAVDMNGNLVGNGALREEFVEDADWKKDETRVFPMPGPVPPGTVKLWMGYDEKPDGAQVVPAAVEVR